MIKRKVLGTNKAGNSIVKVTKEDENGKEVQALYEVCSSNGITLGTYETLPEAQSCLKSFDPPKSSQQSALDI
ncbi:hypothetical protein [Vibrio diabolicus]|uniref:hypothetical protein n=1 Tax=Vibrio diabolicus TaxID=50719 RepID=UPI00211A1676|nr:hypothetical protein [Vibrio diabolicus]MCQ9052728.1 hypothetical protein [Vibrio diabolicus]MCS0325546.1 hypothetical protein [Vibrio diabolicus]